MIDATAANSTTNVSGRRRGRTGPDGGGGVAATLSSAVLALVMCLLVLGVAGAVILRDGLREETDKRATTPTRTRRARPVRRPRTARRPVRSGALLLLTTAGIGVATAAVLGLVGVALALVLRSVGGEGP